MTLKDRMKQYNFWISLVSACLLVARLIAGKFNYEIDSSLVMDVTTGLCGIFVVLGIISAPTKPNPKTSKKENGFLSPEVQAFIDGAKLAIKAESEYGANSGLVETIEPKAETFGEGKEIDSLDTSESKAVETAKVQTNETSESAENLNQNLEETLTSNQETVLSEAIDSNQESEETEMVSEPNNENGETGEISQETVTARRPQIVEIGGVSLNISNLSNDDLIRLFRR